ncbi:hypothetical protein [Modestobacter sp. SYSU DS0657]
MALRVIYRSHGGENRKDRPEFYGKLLGLVSFIRAAGELDVEVVYLNDGPIPDDRLRLMQATGEIVELPGLGMRGSYRAALAQATSGRWAPEDLVWFSEDDYLYLPSALRDLSAAAERIPEAEYFALYASTPSRPAKRDDEPDLRDPSGWRNQAPWTVGDQHWSRIQSTTSSFGARVGALTEDLGVFRFCMVPHRNMLRDHDTCLVLQGFAPHSYTEQARALIGLSPGGPRERVRSAALAPFLLATNLRSHRRPTRRRLFVAADPNLATHMEVGLLSPGRNWAELASDTRSWGVEQGMLSPEN